MTNTVVFEIGDEQVHVPELTWDVIEDDVMPIIDSMQLPPDKQYLMENLRLREAQLLKEVEAFQPLTNGKDGNVVHLAPPDPRPELTKVQAQIQAEQAKWYVMRGNDIKILAAALKHTRPDLTYEVIRRKLTFNGARDVSSKLGELLRISGFTVAEQPSLPTETETVEEGSTSIISSPTSSIGDTPRQRNGAKLNTP